MVNQQKNRSIHWWTALTIFCLMLLIPYYWIYPKVNILVDGKFFRVRTFDRRVETILKNNNIPYGPLDIINPEVSHKIKLGENIKIIRVSEKVVGDYDILPYTITNRQETKKNLRLVEVQEGFSGHRYRRIKITYHDGREFCRQVVEDRMDKKLVHKLILKNKRGKPVKEYDLTKTKAMTMIATSYYRYDPLCYPGGDGVHTYLGLELRRGLVAVDPKLIPLRTRLYIPGYGYAYAADTGSAIKGKRIDICLDSKQESDRFGKKPLKVYILDKARTW